MRRDPPRVRRWSRWVLALILAWCVLGVGQAVRAARPFVYVTTPEKYIVTPVLSQWVHEIIKQAEADGAEALVIQLDTPGGILESTRDIVKDIMTANVPVFVYVGPSGSRAASAGTFITVASHVAAMAPGTSIGAAHPVSITGGAPDDRKRGDDGDGRGDAVRELLEALRKATERESPDQPEQEEPAAAEDVKAKPAPDEAAEKPEADRDKPDASPDQPEQEEPAAPAEDAKAEPAPAEAAEKPEADGEKPDASPKERKQQDTGTAMGDKIMNDTIAWARTIAKHRGRNADWMEKAVVESESLTEGEALERNVIDYVANDVEHLLALADGRTVELAGGRTVTLHTADAEQRPLSMSFRYRVLGALAHPQILILLLSLGGLGLTMELFNPNGITGVIGAICLILAYFGTQTLPINYAGMLLMLLALVLIIAEVKVVSYGLLTLGAVICFTLGGLMLIDSPEEVLRVHLRDVLPLSLVFGVIAAFLVTLVVRAQQTRPVSGQQGMLDATGVVTRDVALRGQVSLRGELWTAVSDKVIPEGTAVRVRSIDGLTLTVEPTTQPPEPAAAGPTEEGTP